MLSLTNSKQHTEREQCFWCWRQLKCAVYKRATFNIECSVRCDVFGMTPQVMRSGVTKFGHMKPGYLQGVRKAIFTFCPLYSSKYKEAESLPTTEPWVSPSVWTNTNSSCTVCSVVDLLATLGVLLYLNRLSSNVICVYRTVYEGSFLSPLAVLAPHALLPEVHIARWVNHVWVSSFGLYLACQCVCCVLKKLNVLCFALCAGLNYWSIALGTLQMVLAHCSSTSQEQVTMWAASGVWSCDVMWLLLWSCMREYSWLCVAVGVGECVDGCELSSCWAGSSSWCEGQMLQWRTRRKECWSRSAGEVHKLEQTPQHPPQLLWHMYSLLNYSTHIKHFCKPLSGTSAIFLTAKQDNYVPREDCVTSVWPGEAVVLLLIAGDVMHKAMLDFMFDCKGAKYDMYHIISNFHKFCEVVGLCENISSRIFWMIYITRLPFAK